MGTTHVIRTRTRLPIKWLAPETISTSTFSLKTDVLGFGVMVYGIFSIERNYGKEKLTYKLKLL
ncbi:hypothetical protein KIN20_020159 [Parelaphostrongylus tenuis]|uniref:Serine-threonine/tyrosine-protein kinase catalytic domain-containing protein n=1 Tax=Parelaphostrongylus tenuis TaxID=148309 RepID=A0AAD5MQN3_PARTN|nr:hypothetical protein KIN20_020159 [Parelaphostrongylus tenuis]